MRQSVPSLPSAHRLATSSTGCRYVNTTAVKSKISFIDGDKGILRYRGYPIEQLAERSNFLEVCFSKFFVLQTCCRIHSNS